MLLTFQLLDGEGCKYAGMRISKLLPQDSGRWVLLAANSRGAGAAMITLNVTEAASVSASTTAAASHLHIHPLSTVSLLFLLPLLIIFENTYSNKISVLVPLLIFSFITSMSCDFLCLLE